MRSFRVLRGCHAALALCLCFAAIEPSAVAAQVTREVDSDAMALFKWRSIGPANMMGRVTDVEGVPSPSKTFYVASAAGGVWKTTNNGTTFSLIWSGELAGARVASMGDFAVAPSDPDQLWAGTGEEDSRNSISPGGGIFKSEDGGKTWDFKGLEETQAIGRVVVHPTDPDIVYVAALGHIWDANPERGLYRTKDGGETWKLVKYVSDRAGFVDVALDPSDPETVWASSWERVRGPYFLTSGGPGSALWKSTDGGDSWMEVVGDGFPTALKGRIGLAISPSNPRTMYALVEAEKEADGSGGSGLYRSKDRGRSWQKMNDENTRPFYYSQVRVDPNDEDRVYFSSTPVRYSHDGGETFGTTTNGIHVDHHALWIDPADPQRMIVGNDGGVAITFDRGGNWSYLNTIALGQFYDVSYNMDIPYRVCGGLQDNGTWCGPSRLSDGGLGNHHWATIGGGDGFVSAQDPVDPSLVWVESQGGNMRRVNTTTGESEGLDRPDWRDVWRPYQDTIVTLRGQGVGWDDPRITELQTRAAADSAAYHMRWNWNTPFLQSAHHRSWFYAAGNMVVKSTQWGDDLTPISPDLSYADEEEVGISIYSTGGITTDATGAETYGTIVALEESPLREGWLFAGTDDGRVWRTRDDGEHWIELTGRFPGVPEGAYVSRVEASNHDEDRFYVTFDNHRTNDFTPYVYVTDDGGRRFRSLSETLPRGAPDFVHVVKEDPYNEDLVFVGTDVGVYASLDRGASWQPFMNGLPTVPVHDLEIHPRDRELIAGTHGRSIWIVDISPLEQMTKGVGVSGAGLFAPPPALEFGTEARGGESTGQQWFERPTPGSEARIVYFLDDEAAATVAAGVTAEADGEASAGTRSPMVEITVTDQHGEVVRTLTGPAEAGYHEIIWDLRGEAPEAPPLSPYEERTRKRIAARAGLVADSLRQAGGWTDEFLDRMVGIATGETSRRQAFAGFGGGQARGGRDPEAFRERPGETPPGGGRGMDYGRMRTFADLVNPGGGLGGLFRGRDAGPAPLAEPGTYTLTLRVGDRSYSKQLTVLRQEGFGRSPE